MIKLPMVSCTILLNNYLPPPERISTCVACVANSDYCDPSWTPKPNMNRALLGIDIAKKHPMPVNYNGDPSFKSKIFIPMYREEKGTGEGTMNLYPFVQHTDNLHCSAEFESSSSANMKQYIKSSAHSSMSGWSIGYTGPKVTGTISEDLHHFQSLPHPTLPPKEMVKRTVLVILKNSSSQSVAL